MTRKKVIVVCGPSGSGKTSIMKVLLNRFDCLCFSVSATTRPKRPHETDGNDYYFLSIEEFKNQIDQKAFIEYEEVYTNIFYGTLYSEIERINAEGETALLDIDVIGALNIKKLYSEEAICLFIHPGSIENLKKRLISRGTESEESLGKRLDKASYEMSFSSQFDKIIYNDSSLEESIESCYTFLSPYLSC